MHKIITPAMNDDTVVIKALCYKPEGRGFDTRWGDFYIYLIQGATPWGLLGL
jgi:hypothetical protein